jgi:RNA polymerase sigma-70 factor (ECF subfamily)
VRATRQPDLAEQALAHADRLYNFAHYLCGNRADAEDLVQETYARALDRANRFTPGSNLAAWLFAILRNLFVDGRRRAAHARTTGGFDTANPAVEPEPDHAALRGDQELERLRTLVGAEIEAALMTLGEEQRTVILMDVEGLTETEIARVLGCAVGTVKSRLSRARSALRERLREYAK